MNEARNESVRIFWSSDDPSWQDQGVITTYGDIKRDAGLLPDITRVLRFHSPLASVEIVTICGQRNLKYKVNQIIIN